MSHKYMITNINLLKNSRSKNTTFKFKIKTKSNYKFNLKPYYQNIKPLIQKENEHPQELRDMLNYIIKNDVGVLMIKDTSNYIKKRKNGGKI